MWSAAQVPILERASLKCPLMCRKGMKIFNQNERGLLGSHLHVSALLQNFPGIDILSLSEPHIIIIINNLRIFQQDSLSILIDIVIIRVLLA